MKNVSSLKPNVKVDSPKTPGGISKSLLTPCRRVGLSRNWKKSGPSPFISPLAGNSEAKLEKKDDAPIKRDTRKRKERCDDECISESLLTPKSQETSHEADKTEETSAVVNRTDELETTPCRNVSNPRRKKSKTLLPVSKDIIETESPKTATVAEHEIGIIGIGKGLNDGDGGNKSLVETPVRTKSKSKIKTIDIESPKANEIKENRCDKESGICNEKENSTVEYVIKKRSPENLTKECIVVLQKKIYKKDFEKLEQTEEKQKIINPVSQALFDSDSDDTPLSKFNNKEVKSRKKLETLDEDDDFEDNTKIKVKKLIDKTTSIGGLKPEPSKKKIKLKKNALSIKSKPKNVEISKHVRDPKPCSQSSIDDDDDDDEDFVMESKRTILIRKSYDKVIKPSKAKSTGSITQKDIDELKAKIEVKKKLLLAKAVTKDTEELRELIKKWQKGCQDALMELMELMKNKFPDKQNMDYSEILRTLKIPASLVGYDEDNDCFGTPTDESIILSKFNDT